MALRESQIRTDDRWVVFHNMKDKLSVDAKLCGIPYHRDFKLVSSVLLNNGNQLASENSP